MISITSLEFSFIFYTGRTSLYQFWAADTHASSVATAPQLLDLEATLTPICLLKALPYYEFAGFHFKSLVPSFPFHIRLHYEFEQSISCGIASVSSNYRLLLLSCRRFRFCQRISPCLSLSSFFFITSQPQSLSFWSNRNSTPTTNARFSVPNRPPPPSRSPNASSPPVSGPSPSNPFPVPRPTSSSSHLRTRRVGVSWFTWTWGTNARLASMATWLRLCSRATNLVPWRPLIQARRLQLLLLRSGRSRTQRQPLHSPRHQICRLVAAAAQQIRRRRRQVHRLEPAAASPTATVPEVPTLHPLRPHHFSPRATSSVLPLA